MNQQMMGKDTRYVSRRVVGMRGQVEMALDNHVVLPVPPGFLVDIGDEVLIEEVTTYRLMQHYAPGSKETP